jgi:hypothetical protein
MPEAPNYAQTMADTLLAQQEMESGTGRFASVGPRINLERKYAPQYQNLQMDLLKQSLPDILSIYQNQIDPAMSATENASRFASRQGDIQSIEQLGPRARAAMIAANPDQARLVDQTTNMANAQLSAGGQLTPEQQRMVQQDTRSAYADRGFATSPMAATSEIVRSQLASQGIMDNRQNAALRALSMGQSFYGDPFQQILGRPSNAMNAGMNTFGQAQGFNPGAIFNPESSMASQMANNSYQGQLAANTANASNSSSLLGAGLGMFGMLGGAGIKKWG